MLFKNDCFEIFFWAAEYLVTMSFSFNYVVLLFAVCNKIMT